MTPLKGTEVLGCADRGLTRRPERLAILLVIVALATFMCWLIGLHAIARAERYRLQANSPRHSC